MNPVQEQLAASLSQAIRNQSYDLPKNLDVQALMAEACEHDVEGLVYKSLKNQLDLSIYKESVILKSMTQSAYMKKGLNLIQELQEQGLTVVLLKGSILKFLYPIPDLRTMGDIDLLVPMDQLNRVDACLVENGYTKKDGYHAFHHVYEGEGFNLEVHWKLCGLDKSEYQEFESSIWKSLQNFRIEDLTYRTLNSNDFLIHMFIHLSTHMKSSGFGMRQLCDLVVWIEHYNDLDWVYIKEQLQRLKILTFSLYMLELCYRLLNLSEIKEMKSEMIDDETITQLLQIIYLNGVHGKRNQSVRHVARYASRLKKNTILKAWLSWLFPSKKYMYHSYPYVLKYSWLLPIGYLHRLLRTTIRPMNSFKERLHYFFNTPQMAKKRGNILEALDLIE